MSDKTRQYEYHDTAPTWANHYLWPPLVPEAIAVLKAAQNRPAGSRPRAFDMGCGNGATTDFLARLGFEASGVDLSESGIAAASKAFPASSFEVASVYDDLASRHGRFPLVVSLEVIEHCYDPRAFARTLYNLLEPGGTAVVSTPYHGYLKNIAPAASGKMDRQFSALWDGGHIKFFSISTLGTLLGEVGFRDMRFLRVGRIPPLAKSMIAIARRGEDT